MLRRKTPLGDDNLREINSGDFQYSRNNDDAPQIHPQTSTADTSASFSTGPQIHPHHFFGERARRSELTNRLSCVNTISICVLFLRQISLCTCSNSALTISAEPGMLYRSPMPEIMKLCGSKGHSLVHLAEHRPLSRGDALRLRLR